MNTPERKPLFSEAARRKIAEARAVPEDELRRQLEANSGKPTKTFTPITPAMKARFEQRDQEYEARRIENERANAEFLRTQQRTRAVARWRLGFPKLALQWLDEHPDADWPQGVFSKALQALEGGKSLLLAGDVGPGKTTMATKLCGVMAQQHGLESRYITAADWVGEFKHVCWNQKTHSEGQYLDACAKVPIMVLEEFDKRNETGHETATLSRLIDRRYASAVPTIIITNLPLEAFEKSVPRYIYDRLRQIAEPIVFNWPSFRSRKDAS